MVSISWFGQSTMHRGSQHWRHAELCRPPDVPSGCEVGQAAAGVAANQANFKFSIRRTLALLRRQIMAASLGLLVSHPAAALDQVSLQLKWKHQVQFAGYYAALEQGFYRDAGLDVSIREGGPGIDVAETVSSGKADFGACSANVLREWAAGRRLVVLAVIFHRSPHVILGPLPERHTHEANLSRRPHTI